MEGKTHIKNIVNEIRRLIEITSGSNQPKPERRFHKHSEYIAYGLSTADFRKITKELQSQFCNLPLQKQLTLSEQLLKEFIGELGHIGIYILTLNAQKLSPEHFPVLDRLPEHFRSWSHVDHLSLGVMNSLLLKYPKETLSLLKEWNRSQIRWKRRASIVVFTREIAKSGKFTDEVIQLSENLIWDKEDIVQKGVGWALKDNMRSSPERIFEYVKDLRRRGVPSTITLYAIRDLKGEKRKEVLSIKP